MTGVPPRFDNWDDLRVFAATAACGSMVEAARQLGVTHSTVSRRLSALELAAGGPLFHRTGQGVALTAAGQKLFEQVRLFDGSLDALLRWMHQTNARDAVTFTLACTEGLAAYWLTRFLPAFSRRHPTLTLRVRTETAIFEDRRPSYDAQIQFFQPAEPASVTQRLGTLHFLPMATQEYLDRFGAPRSREDQTEHHWIDYLPLHMDRGSWSNWFGDAKAAHPSALVTNSTASVAQAVLAGAGIAMLPTYFCALYPQLVALDLDKTFAYPIWMTWAADPDSAWQLKAVGELAAEAFDLATMPWFADTLIRPEAFGAAGAGTGKRK